MAWLSADELAANLFAYKSAGGWISRKQTEVLYKQWQREAPLSLQYEKGGMMVDRKLPAYGKYQEKHWKLSLRYLGPYYAFPYNGYLELLDELPEDVKQTIKERGNSHD